MAQKVTYSDEHHLIRVEAKGRLTEEDIQQAINDARILAEEKGVSKFIVDQSGITSVPTSSITQFNVGANMASVFKSGNIAIVHANSLKSDYEFVAKVTSARGANIQLFTDVQSAMDWLDSLGS